MATLYKSIEFYEPFEIENSPPHIITNMSLVMVAITIRPVESSVCTNF